MTAVKMNEWNPSLIVTGSTAYNYNWYQSWSMCSGSYPCAPKMTVSAVDSSNSFTFNYLSSSNT
ncbi:hypothetical protein E6H19_07115 [Candidatus Bathyarchaeota archaeon]|nr:MAG: hypothetical protein E6H19_07115 [Candidatus Bathyarchaeota archaeon]